MDENSADKVTKLETFEQEAVRESEETLPMAAPERSVLLDDGS